MTKLQRVLIALTIIVGLAGCTAGTTADPGASPGSGAIEQGAPSGYPSNSPAVQEQPPAVGTSPYPEPSAAP